MVEVIWYFSQGLGVVASSGRIEWGGEEERNRGKRTENSREGKGEEARGGKKEKRWC